MNRFLKFLQSVIRPVQGFFIRTWTRYRALPLWGQIAIGVVLIAVLVGAFFLLKGKPVADTASATRTVTLQSVSGLSGSTSGVGIIGTVRSVTEANVLTQTGGTVRAVHTTIGASVPAGFVIAELSNASEAASVLQAEGAYEAALASRNATQLQSGNTATSFVEAQTAARNTYRSTFTTVDSTLRNNVDTFFGGPTATGPALLISPLTSGDTLSRERRTINDLMNTWNDTLPNVNNTDPATLLNTASANLTTISLFLNDLSRIANDHSSGATATQLSNLATARATIDGQIAAISAARDTYQAKKTAADVAKTQTISSNTATASADAAVKQALGVLRGAQANYEKTIVRAPIAGTVNFLAIHVGDYITSFTHVATVARNNALEIVAYVSQDDRTLIAAGDSVLIEGTVKGIVTSVSPALNPTTKQIEVHIAVNDGSNLVDGQAVHIVLPQSVQKPQTTAVATTTQNVMLPLSAVKLRTSDRIIFTVDASGKLVAHQVEIGDVIGDRIEITSPLSPDLMVVTDARGLSEGEKVLVATSTAATQ